MVQEFKAVLAKHRVDVFKASGRHIVDTKHFVTATEKSATKVGADKTGPTENNRKIVSLFIHGMKQINKCVIRALLY